MSLDDWACNHCGVGLDDDCIRLPDPREASYCYECAQGIAAAFSAARGHEFQAPSNNDREILDRLDALEDLTRRVKNVWVLWLNDATKGAINPGTFHTMKNMLGIEEA